MEKAVTRDDRRWCLGLSLLLIVLTSIPYLAGFQTQSSEWSYTGFVFGVGDGNSYIAKMLQGESAWLFRTPYSSVESGGVLAFSYLLLKLAAARSAHQMLALFHLAAGADPAWCWPFTGLPRSSFRRLLAALGDRPGGRRRGTGLASVAERKQPGLREPPARFLFTGELRVSRSLRVAAFAAGEGPLALLPDVLLEP
jgi:hypothetical protein